MLAILAGWIAIVQAALPDNEVFLWLQEYWLTKYNTEKEFRPNDSITRGEAAKFVAQYANAAWLETVAWNCSFNDTTAYDETLRPFITQACDFGLLKWYKGKFMPHNNITQAQALAIVVRSLYWYQDENISPWYMHYYTIWQEIGLVNHETIAWVDHTIITREQLAKWLHTAFYLEDEDNNRDDNGFVYETDVDSSEDCTSYEQYDSSRKVCYFTCNTQAQCDLINNQVDAELDSWTSSLEDADRDFTEHWTNQSAEQTSKVVYTVSAGEKITKKSGTDKDTYQTIRNEVAELSPDTISDKYIESFEVFDDTNSDVSAFVADEDGNGKRHMAINLAIHNSSDIKEQKAVIVHELSHIITLNNDQMISPTGQCPNYETDEWCTKESSYLNKFYQKFWKGITNPSFNTSSFVTEYATTNTEEDIAESFAFFVLESNHTTTTVRNQKVAFFNDFSELINMRNDMRNALTKYAIRLKKDSL